LVDGTPIDYIIFLDDYSFTITNYHLSIETHNLGFKTSGFQQVYWHNPVLSADIANDTDRRYWSDFLDHPQSFS